MYNNNNNEYILFFLFYVFLVASSLSAICFSVRLSSLDPRALLRRSSPPGVS